MVGKLEKSNGLNAFIATIKISKESKILLVKIYLIKKMVVKPSLQQASIFQEEAHIFNNWTYLMKPKRLSVISMTYSPGQNYDYF